jgi:riboflavin synthase
MFTGLIAETGIIEDIRKLSGITRLAVKTPSLHKDAVLGDSIAVDGVCLTVADISGDVLSFDLSGETIKSTNMERVKKGDRVNLEPSLHAGGKMGGHFVTGHVDGTGRIMSKKRVGDTIEIEVEAPGDMLQYLVDKGSVAVDGISLTVVKVLTNSFLLVIIPHTEKVTNLKDKRRGDIVNIETDIIGKYVKKYVDSKRDGTIMEKLKNSGFIESA